MLFLTTADRFVLFALCRATALAEAFPAEDHKRVLPTFRLPVLRCYRETATVRGHVRRHDTYDPRQRSLRELLQVPDKRWPEIVLSCCEWRECDRTDPPVSHPVAGGAAQNCERPRGGNFG